MIKWKQFMRLQKDGESFRIMDKSQGPGSPWDMGRMDRRGNVVSGGYHLRGDALVSVMDFSSLEAPWAFRAPFSAMRMLMRMKTNHGSGSGPRARMFAFVLRRSAPDLRYVIPGNLGRLSIPVLEALWDQGFIPLCMEGARMERYER